MSKITASEFLNGDTVFQIQTTIGTVRALHRQFQADYFADGETRADFLQSVPKTLSTICEAMVNHVYVISKYGLHSHEYAKEIMELSVECHRQARSLCIRIEAKRYGQRGAA